VAQFIAGISGHLRFGNRNIDRNSGSESFATRKRDQSFALTCRKLFKTSKSEIHNYKSDEGETKNEETNAFIDMSFSATDSGSGCLRLCF